MRKLLLSKLHKKICSVIVYAMLINLNIGWINLLAAKAESGAVKAVIQDSVDRLAKQDFSGKSAQDQSLSIIFQKLTELELIRENLAALKDCMGDQIETTRDGQTVSTVFEYLTKILDRVSRVTAQSGSFDAGSVEKLINQTVQATAASLGTLNSASRQSDSGQGPIQEILAKLCALQACLLDPCTDPCCPPVCLKDRIKNIQCVVCDIDQDTDNILCNQVSIFSKLCVIQSGVDNIEVSLTDCCQEIINDLIFINNQLIAIYENILAQLEVIEIEIANVQITVDACCSSLDDCCSVVDVIDSKVDVVDIDVLNVQSSLDECCSTLEDLDYSILSQLDVIESKVDNVDVDVLNVQSTLDECCSTLEDLDYSIFSQLDVIESKIDAIDCSIVESKLEQCCSVIDEIEVIVFDLAACAAKPLFGPTTITTAGTYCLANDIVGHSPAIVINTSGVVLDLNNHSILNSGTTNVVGVQINNNQSNVVIKNGFVRGSGIGIGIDVLATGTFSTTSGIVLEKLGVSGWQVGVSADSVNGLVFVDTHVNGNTTGVLLDSCSNVKLHDSNFSSNTTDGIDVIGGSTNVNMLNCLCNNNAYGLYVNANSVHVENCVFDANGCSGVLVQDSQYLELLNCSANGSDASLGNAFDFQTTSTAAIFSQDIVVNGCVATNYGNGFSGLNVTALCLDNCIAKGNNCGFAITGDSSAAIVKGCIAAGNVSDTADTCLDNSNTGCSGYGFYDDGLGADNQYYANEACGNIINFAPAITSNAYNTGVVTSPMNARGVANVDCLNSTLDSVEVTLSLVECIDEEVECICELVTDIESSLDVCCATIISKLDTLATPTAVVDFSGTYTMLDAIYNKEIAIQTQIEECCSTLESLDVEILSKLAEIDTNIDTLLGDFQGTFTVLDAFQTDVDSKFDIVFQDFQSTWTLIGDVYDASFNCTSFTTTADIDGANLNVIQWLKTIYRDLRGFAGPCV